jgi:beta-N-acetylhexosaminidase
MRAVSRRFEDSAAAVRALRAGADVLLVPKDPERLVAGLRAALADRRLQRLASRAQARLSQAKQDAELSGLGAPRPGRLACVGAAKHRELAERMAEACLAWNGRCSALAGRRLLYAEPGTAPRDWQGRDFLARLRSLGASVRPASEGSLRSGEPLVLGVFLKPRAYTGRIELGRRELAEARGLAAKAAESVVVCFGSPFVLAGFPESGGLCAFCDNAAAQRAAARALLGRASATGRMPVAIGAAQ